MTVKTVPGSGKPPTTPIDQVVRMHVVGANTESWGSGFILPYNGWLDRVITSRHLIKGNGLQAIRLEDSTGGSFDGVACAFPPGNDLATEVAVVKLLGPAQLTSDAAGWKVADGSPIQGRVEGYVAGGGFASPQVQLTTAPADPRRWKHNATPLGLSGGAVLVDGWIVGVNFAVDGALRLPSDLLNALQSELA